ncbi:hypothetical protein D3C81_1905530 [compost metagenome]
MIVTGPLRLRARGGDRFALRMGGELQVDGIEAQQYLAAPDRLPGIHQPLQNLAGHAKAQVALDPGRDYACE